MCNLRSANANITYAQVKDEFEQRFCEDEYMRNLQIKLKNLKFKGTPINSFATELRNTIISDLAMNHLLSTLDEILRGEAKIFQLTGNKTLRNFLEFVNTKMGIQSLSHSVEYAAIVDQNCTHERISHQRCSVKNVFLEISQNSQENTYTRGGIWHRCFPVNFEKFLRTPFL